MFEKCIEVIKRGKRVIYVAPSRELINFVREKIIEKLGGLIYIEVITFDDLARGIAEPFVENKELISVDASEIIFENIISELIKNKQIKYFEKVGLKKGFITSILNTIRRIKKENLSPDEFRNKINNLNDDDIKAKTEDVYRIYSKYQEQLKELDILDMEDLIKVAETNTGRSDYFRDVELFVLDGYVDIFENEKALLRAIKESNPFIEFLLHVPLRTKIINDFIKDEILKLESELEFKIVDVDYFEDTQFKRLAQQLFSFDRLNSKVNGINIFNAPCIEDEVRQAAKNIKRISLNEKIDLDKIAIVVSNLEEYEDYILDVFNEFDLPVILGDYERLSNIPLIKSIFSILSLRLNSHDIKREEYVLSSPYLFHSQIERNIEEIKNKLSKIKSTANFSEYKKEIEDIIDDFKIKDKIINLYKEGIISSEIMIRDFKALFAFYEMLKDLENVYKFLKRELQVEELIDVLKDNLFQRTVTLKNKKTYGVKILSPDILRGTSYDYVFILGLNEDVFPKVPKIGGIYTAREREILYKNGINIGNSFVELIKEKIRFVLSFAAARKGLYLSYRTSEEDGSYIIKSQFLDEVIYTLNLEEEFKKIPLRCMRNRFELQMKDIFTSKEFAKKYALTEYMELDKDEFNEKFNIFLKLYDIGRNVEYLRNSEDFTNFDGLIGKEKAEKFRKDYAFSASKINNFNSCLFKFYVENALEIDFDEEDDELSNVSIGNIYHEILKEYYNYFLNNEIEYDEAWVEDCVKKVVDKKGIFDSDMLNRRRINEILTDMKEFIKNDVMYSKSCNLKPYYLETPFEINDLIDGVRIKGKIDRIDLEVIDGNPTGYFVVYDYKRGGVGSKNLSGILKGDDIQIPLYYYAAIEKLKKNGFEPKCMALLYYSIKDTLKEIEKENTKKDKKKEFLRPKFSGIIIEEKRETLGFAKNTDTLSEVNLDTAIEHVRLNFIAEKIEQIKRGEFIFPFECPALKPFSSYFCPFLSVCRYDKKRISKKVNLWISKE
ncbi:ATP-dependent helicase/deoxyribonuclease subunit B [Caloramator mitchellensis]|uniref:ATP-dependent helicase/deoxyribonuclease subunit B n=1 Tax=Caloramator mitchellensis TaxID=908809 RepID=A0A0R3K169_CALMK|nr:PD-(D/E)XK nuclease family protein [Caloramator mitchellensis]KRQ87140.1 ATP-dependent helicase/deoxyribonuclease subunit B [Caloramator mitchellensis]